MDRSAPPLSVKEIFPLLYWLAENGIPLGKWLKIMVRSIDEIYGQVDR